LIEHHLDVIKTADHVIDLGPEGGHAGGQVVATGTPEEIAACEKSHTGRFLKSHLPTGPVRPAPDEAAGKALRRGSPRSPGRARR
jgi:excinuclease ABC subunit A